MVRINALLLILGLLLTDGCLKKQNLPVQPPEWGTYLVQGVVRDSLTYEPIYHAMIVLSPIQVLFADTMEPETTYTGVNGFFSIGPVPAVWGELKAISPGYRPYYKTVVIQRDRYFDIYLSSVRRNLNGKD